MPNLDYKRIILGGLILIIGVGLIIGVLWLVFFRQPAEDAPAGGDVAVGVGGELPGTGVGGVIGLISPPGQLPGEPGSQGEEDGLITDFEVEGKVDNVASGSLTQVTGVMEDELADVNLGQGSLSYLSIEDDKFYRISLDGSGKTLLSDKEFPHVEDAYFSPDNRKVILEYPDGANIIYDLASGKQISLPQGMTDPSWRNNSEGIAYKYISDNDEDNWLLIADDTGGKTEAVEHLGDQGDSVQVSWSPTNEVVALYHKSVGLNKEEVFFIGLNDENNKSLVVEGSNFKGIWSPQGDRILYQVIDYDNNYNPILWVADAQGDNIGGNNFNLGLSTWVDKCVFARDNKTVYCAVPVSLPEGAGFYPDLLNDSADVFYKIDLSTGLSRLVAYPVLSESIDSFQVKKIFITDDSSRLYFWDAFTNKLYYLRLR